MKSAGRGRLGIVGVAIAARAACCTGPVLAFLASLGAIGLVTTLLER